MRILFLDTARHGLWGAQPNRFAPAAAELTRAGHSVLLASDEDVADLPFPLVCGSGRAGDTAPLRDTYRLTQQLRGETFDLIVAPLGGGIAHGLLTMRACGEAFGTTRIALWGHRPSRSVALGEDRAPSGLSPLVADAMERTCLRLADRLIVPGQHALDEIRTLGTDLPPILNAGLPLPDIAPTGPAPSPLRDITFVGPLSRENGAYLFMDAMEELARRGELEPRTVTFLGPANERDGAISLENMGVRAARWDFRFRLEGTTDREHMLQTLAEPGRLAVFAALRCGDDPMLRMARKAGVPLIATAAYDSGEDGAGPACPANAQDLADTIAAALRTPPKPSNVPEDATDWPALLREIAAAPIRSPATQNTAIESISVCVVTRNREATLLQALASVGDCPGCAVELVVFDNAGDAPLALPVLGAATPHPVRLVRSERHLSPAAAYNAAVAEAGSDALLFLDDDNILTEDGLSRFATALRAGWFDIVTTTLDLVDGNAAEGVSTGRFIFMGEAASAGLFFNGFGDRAAMMRRDAFLALGGFPDPGYHAPVSDWAFFARAQAAGLRIGVLQDPALRYARRLGGEATNWLKNDGEGAKRFVLETCGSAIDGALVARFAQALQRLRG
ncbi:Glycosyl transferase family 2 [Faunimonas pinastri]|uniref:Glycosyl transferase family 2 n=2 Tax=Faunimonas pinastri TaxID=1855383 RepID=A0A1H9FFE0_9HYPH|nr:Glycosyl transferase family 2 [Faunimonas pinastri]